MTESETIQEQFEDIYSLSIRRGEDSSVVWKWINETHAYEVRKRLIWLILKKLGPEFDVDGNHAFIKTKDLRDYLKSLNKKP